MPSVCLFGFALTVSIFELLLIFSFYEFYNVCFNHIQLEEYNLFNPITQLTITTTGSVVPFYVCIFHFSTIYKLLWILFYSRDNGRTYLKEIYAVLLLFTSEMFIWFCLNSFYFLIIIFSRQRKPIFSRLIKTYKQVLDKQ